MKKNWIIWSLLGFVAFFASACKDDEVDEAKLQRELLERQTKEIEAYLTQQGITAKNNGLGIFQEVLQQNNAGQLIESGDVALVNYRIKTLDGTLIGASQADKPQRIVYSRDVGFFPVALYFGLAGDQNVHVGGSYRYYVPSAYGFAKYSDEKVSQDAILMLEYDVVGVLNTVDEVYQAEQADIQAWLQQENKTAEELPNGLHKIVLQAGSGAEPVSGDTALVRYKGYHLNKQVFDDNLEKEDPFMVIIGKSPVVKGFMQAIKTMQLGEKSLFILPSSQAYGASGAYVLPREMRESFIDKGAILKTTGSIPPLSTLIFEIELVEIK